MKKIYSKLTNEQRLRGVIFSSQLIGGTFSGTEHEVLEFDKDIFLKIERLKDDSFFNKSPYKYNLIKE